jgi:hypothetical protein
MSCGRYAIFPETGNEVVTSDPEKPAVLDTRFFTVRMSTAETECAKWRRESVPVGLRARPRIG